MAKTGDDTGSQTSGNIWVCLNDEAATERLGEILAKKLTLTGIIFLSGQLGTGKTTFVRAVLRALGYSGPVKSPTYTLVEEYQLAVGNIFHFDLYRLADPEELEFIGMRDYLASGALLFIEWPDKGEGMLPHPDLEIDIGLNGHGRRVSLSAHTAPMKAAINGIGSYFH